MKTAKQEFEDYLSTYNLGERLWDTGELKQVLLLTRAAYIYVPSTTMKGIMHQI